MAWGDWASIGECSGSAQSPIDIVSAGAVIDDHLVRVSGFQSSLPMIVGVVGGVDWSLRGWFLTEREREER